MIIHRLPFVTYQLLELPRELEEWRPHLTTFIDEAALDDTPAYMLVVRAYPENKYIAVELLCLLQRKALYK